LKSSASVSFGNAWIFTSEFPVFNREMTLDEALSLPTSLVKRYDVPGNVGAQTAISLPADAVGRVIRVWGKQAGEMKIPEIEVISR
jgi:hypothetical protein